MTHHDDPKKQRPTRQKHRGAAYNLSQLQFVVFLTSTQPMTPAILVNEVAPYLKAMADFQQLINEIKARPWPEVQLISVVKDSMADNAPIFAELRGVVDAIAFMQTIINWRRKQAELAADLNGVVSDTSLHQAKVQLALEILEKASPHLDEAAKVGYAARMLEPLEVLVSSSLEVGAYDSEDV